MPIPVRPLRPLALVLLLLLAACARETEQAVVSDETFLAVMVELRRAAAVHSGDTVSFRAARDSILRTAGVTDSALYAWVDARAADPERMGGVFDEIRDSLRARPDTVRR